MATSITPPRGMRDFLPAEKRRRERLLGLIRDVYTRHGFDEIETPVLEDASRLHSGLGGDNEKLAYAVLRRGLDRDDLEAAAAAGDPFALADLGLRFDLTVPLARFYATHHAELPNVFRALQIAPVWRAERPQKGRFRQFVQCDIDIVGEPGPLAEIELLAATGDALTALGLSGASIRVNDRAVLARLLDACGFAEEHRPSALISIDKLDKIGATGVVDELAVSDAGAAAALGTILARLEGALADGIPVDAEAIAAALPEVADDEALPRLHRLAEAMGGERAGDGSVPLVFDPTLVRGMGYYTGTIFEIQHPDFSYSLGGGGRYDGMIGRFLGRPVAACGFSLGFERLVDAVESRDVAHAESMVLVHDRDVEPARLVELKTALVRAGVRVRLERRVKNLKALLARAADDGYESFAVVGADVRGADELEARPLG